MSNDWRQLTNTVRDEVLAAFKRLERRQNRTAFALGDVVQEVLAANPSRPDSTVRTYVSSVMCREAPVNHGNHTDDLERMDRGMYRRILASDSDLPAPSRRPEVTARPAPAGRQPATDERAETADGWPWEGAVQLATVAWLQTEGWTVLATADTRSRQGGADITAIRGNERLVVEVKGFPGAVYQRGERSGQSKPTAPATQARQYFAGAILSALLHRAADQDARVVIALPDYPTYRGLVTRTRASLAAARVEFAILNLEGRLVAT